MTDKSEITYINPFVRGTSGAIDIFIVGFLRALVSQIIWTFFLFGKVVQFHKDFAEKFNADFSSKNQEHIAFLLHHQVTEWIIFTAILVIFVGAYYHAFLNSSTWCGTIGKKFFGLILVKKDGKNLTFGEALSHYLLSLIPWIFMFYIVMYVLTKQVSVYNALVGDSSNMVMGILIVIWMQVHILTKKKNTVNDMIVGCMMVKGKLEKGWPKSRKKVTKVIEISEKS